MPPVESSSLSPAPETPPEDSNKSGGSVYAVGGVAIALALLPLMFVTPDFATCGREHPTVWAPILVLWALIIGWLLGACWSSALHKWINAQSLPTGDKPAAGCPAPLPLLAGAIGFFERLFYVAFTAVDYGASGAFIGAWIAIKMSEGWKNSLEFGQLGRARFFAALLGNALSLVYGLAAGLGIRTILHSA